ncbi:MAG: D-alanyl-D-alanine carboxypeptidase [Lewinellaceae bacterium]|nr:D-alanyl-D-alanine carboxypeptidase [Lewinellaceae bacterium]
MAHPLFHPIDTVLRRMMHQSDNFIAEQMLLVCAGMKFDLLKQDTMIKWMLDSSLTNLTQRPKWVDGSGLSRYNLMTPQSIGQVLLKLWRNNRMKGFYPFFPQEERTVPFRICMRVKMASPTFLLKPGAWAGCNA